MRGAAWPVPLRAATVHRETGSEPCRTEPRVFNAVTDEGGFVIALIAFALSMAAMIIGFTQAKDFVSRRLRYVDAARSPLAPLVAGAGAALIAAPIVWLLPFMGGASALAFGLSVGLGVAAGNKEIRRSLPPG